MKKKKTQKVGCFASSLQINVTLKTDAELTNREAERDVGDGEGRV